jgi:hypothetical protein
VQLRPRHLRRRHGPWPGARGPRDRVPGVR